MSIGIGIGRWNVQHEDRSVQSIGDLPTSELEDIERFFVQSGEREGNRLPLLGRAQPAEALRILCGSMVGK